MSLWLLCRVWNTTALLCICRWYTEAVQEEEEDSRIATEYCRGCSVHEDISDGYKSVWSTDVKFHLLFYIWFSGVKIYDE